MNSALNQLYSQFHFKSLKEVEHLKLLSAQVVKDIQNLVNEDLEIDVFIEPLSKEKKRFEVKLKVIGLGDVIVARKVGKNPILLLKKNRRTVMRAIRKRLGKKRYFEPFRTSAAV